MSESVGPRLEKAEGTQQTCAAEACRCPDGARSRNVGVANGVGAGVPTTDPGCEADERGPRTGARGDLRGENRLRTPGAISSAASSDQGSVPAGSSSTRARRTLQIWAISYGRCNISHESTHAIVNYKLYV